MFAAALLGSGGSAGGQSGGPPGSTYNTETDGLSGIYEVLSAQKAASRWELGFDRLPENVDRLVVWQPSAIEDDAWKKLQAWVSQGHTLVIAAEDDRLPGFVTTEQPTTAKPVALAPATVGVGEVSVGPDGFAGLNGGQLTHLARSDGSPMLVSWSQGAGRIYWSADPEWLTNKRIGQADNLALALRLLTPEPGRQVAFDEYDHGFAAAERWWQLLRGPLQLFLLQLVVVLAVFYWAYGARFGAPRPLPAGPPRAAVEYVYSMSHLYRRARARAVVLQALHKHLTRELGRLLGGTGGMNHAGVARAVSAQTGVPAAELAALLDRTDPQRKDTPSEAELIALAREVEAMQRRVCNAGYRDQRDAAAGTK